MASSNICQVFDLIHIYQFIIFILIILKQKQQFLMKNQPSNDQEKKVRQMVLKVMEEKDDWAKHLHNNCRKCQVCNCGKHLCKFKSIQFDLKPTCTTYTHDYTPKKRLKSAYFSKPIDKKNVNPITKKSTYKKDYPPKKGQYRPVSQKKPNNLQVGGPSFNKTTYGNSFKAYQSPKKQEPLKNPNNLVLNGAKMNTKSNYDDNYKWRPGSASTQLKPQKYADTLKIDGDLPFRSQTSYNNYFNEANAKNICPRQTFAPNNVYAPQKGVTTKSSYRDAYYAKKSSVCPAALL